jgi:hypothetical protein
VSFKLGASPVAARSLIRSRSEVPLVPSDNQAWMVLRGIYGS